MHFSGLCLQRETSLQAFQPCVSSVLKKDTLTSPFLNQPDPFKYFPWIISFMRMGPKNCLGLKQSKSFSQHLCFRTFYTLKATKLCQIGISHQDPSWGGTGEHLCWKLCPRHYWRCRMAALRWACPSTWRGWVQSICWHTRWACAAVTTLISIRQGLQRIS